LYLQKPLAIPNSRNTSTEESRHPDEVGQHRRRVVCTKYRAASPKNDGQMDCCLLHKSRIGEPKARNAEEWEKVDHFHLEIVCSLEGIHLWYSRFKISLQNAVFPSNRFDHLFCNAFRFAVLLEIGRNAWKSKSRLTGNGHCDRYLAGSASASKTLGHLVEHCRRQLDKWMIGLEEKNRICFTAASDCAG